jgi:N-methylhydantoinase A
LQTVGRRPPRRARMALTVASDRTSPYQWSPMSLPQASKARLAIDVGGTFTDVVLDQSGEQWTSKVLTTHDAPERGVIGGVEATLNAAGVRPDDVGFIIHGTTLATNALIERKGARTALLTTEGFRDTIELGTESRFDQYDVNLVKQAPLVPRNWRIPIVERVAADGEILCPLDEASAIDAIGRLRAQSIESVAVAFLHSYVQPAHEQRMRVLLHDLLPDVSVSLSSEVSPEMREYERFTTTCANAYVQPLVAGYLMRLENDLKTRGLSCQLFLMLSSGGITTVETARAFPIRLIESGPAGGAIFAQNVARRHGVTSAVSFDMGGTTAKICLIDDFKPQTSRTFEVSRSSRFQKGSGIPLRIPVIEMVEIGAGGGSIARVDRLGRIAVGPDSAGSTPGPACYGLGGQEPTVTDADVVLGRIDPKSFAGGQLSLHPELAQAAMVRVGSTDALGFDAEEFAYAIVELVDEAMSNAARVHAVESGRMLSDRTLIAFGGAAPLHVGRVADKLGIARVIVPVGAGVGSAVGFLLAPISYEVARSMYVRLQGFRPERINALLSGMADEARRVVAQGTERRCLSEQRTAFARYIGQGYEIPIALPVRTLLESDAAVLRNAFEQSYLQQYGRLIDGVDIEILAWTVTIGADLPEVKPIATVTDQQASQPSNWRDIFDVGQGAWIKAGLYHRSELPPGSTLAGPAIIVEESTSTVIGPGYDASIVANASIVMTRRAIP